MEVSSLLLPEDPAVMVRVIVWQAFVLQLLQGREMLLAAARVPAVLLGVAARLPDAVVAQAAAARANLAFLAGPPLFAAAQVNADASHFAALAENYPSPPIPFSHNLLVPV